jgi:ribosomal protein S12 methylthiotransferase accessory factor
MIAELKKTYARGTHRLVPPEQTWARIQPLLGLAGITRCADVTGLDTIGVPVYCAMRPRGLALQVSNGKGLRPVDAKVSALMEAIELFHAESPPERMRRASFAELVREGTPAAAPDDLPERDPARYCSVDFQLDWVPALELVGGRTTWVPASAVYLTWPSPFPFSSNGLASGNHLLEATLHALYEVIERDAVSSLSQAGRIRVPAGCQVLGTESISDPVLGDLGDRLRRAGIKLVLLRLPSDLPVSTCAAVLLDPDPFGRASMVNIGYGAHLSPGVAASRAITEAIQSRLTLIHGSREDVEEEAYRSGARAVHEKVYAFFDRLKPNAVWDSLRDPASDSLETDLGTVIDALVTAGYRRIFRVDLTRAPFALPVVKVIVPGMRINRNLV